MITTSTRVKAEKASQLINELSEIATTNPFLSFSEVNGKLKIQVFKLKDLKEVGEHEMSEHKISGTKDSKYPYVAKTYINDVEFFTLLTEEEYQKEVNKIENNK